MCSIQDRLDLFFVPESRDTGLFCLQNGAYLDGKQVHQKFLIENVLYFKGHAASNGLTFGWFIVAGSAAKLLFSNKKRTSPVAMRRVLAAGSSSDSVSAVFLCLIYDTFSSF